MKIIYERLGPNKKCLISQAEPPFLSSHSLHKDMGTTENAVYFFFFTFWDITNIVLETCVNESSCYLYTIFLHMHECIYYGKCE
jgi:hypothetical protein